jgi:hypothetical protein
MRRHTVIKFKVMTFLKKLFIQASAGIGPMGLMGPIGPMTALLHVVKVDWLSLKVLIEPIHDVL